MYAPYGTPPAQLKLDFLTNGLHTQQVSSGKRVTRKLNPAWVVLTEIIYRIEQQKYHMPVGRVIFQKIAYVATSLGLPTGLHHVRSSYGPYCRELDDVKKRLSNDGLVQEEKLGNMLRVFPGPEYQTARNKFKEDLKKWNQLIDKTSDLFLRLNTNQAEIVATVLFTEKELSSNGNVSERDVLNKVMEWKQKRRPPLSEIEVAETIRNLGILKWFSVKPSPDLLDDEF